MPSSLLPAPPRLTHLRSKHSIRRVHNPPRLPPELYRSIISHVGSKRTLHALLFVSKDWFYEAEPMLYRTIRMVQRGFSTRVKLFHRIIACPRVALYVRNLTIVHDIRRRGSAGGAPGPVIEAKDLIPAEQYWLPMNYALRLMDNLQHLHLMLYSYKIEDRPFSPLLGCAFQLKYCTLIGADDRERRPLETQKSLQELELRDGSDLVHLQRPALGRLALPKDALPNLEVVTFGGSQGLHRIRPALRAKRVLLKDPLVRTDKIYEKTRSLFLDMETSGMESVKCFPGLRFLRMHVVHEPLDYFPALLALYCPQLEKLHVHGTIISTPIANPISANPSAPLKIPKISISSLVERLFDAIPTLHTTVLHVNDMMECTEWMRDRFEPLPKEWECENGIGEWREWGCASASAVVLPSGMGRSMEELGGSGLSGGSEERVGALGLSLGGGGVTRSDSEVRRPGWTRLGPVVGGGSSYPTTARQAGSGWSSEGAAGAGVAALTRSASSSRAIQSSRVVQSSHPPVSSTGAGMRGLMRSASSRTAPASKGESSHPPVSGGLSKLAGRLSKVASSSKVGRSGASGEPKAAKGAANLNAGWSSGGERSSGDEGHYGVLRVRGGTSRAGDTSSRLGDDGVGFSSRAPSRVGSSRDLRGAASIAAAGSRTSRALTSASPMDTRDVRTASRAGGGESEGERGVLSDLLNAVVMAGARLERQRSTRTMRDRAERERERGERYVSGGERERGERERRGDGESREGRRDERRDGRDERRGGDHFGSFGRKTSAMF